MYIILAYWSLLGAGVTIDFLGLNMQRDPHPPLLLLSP